MCVTEKRKRNVITNTARPKNPKRDIKVKYLKALSRNCLEYQHWIYEERKEIMLATRYQLFLSLFGWPLHKGSLLWPSVAPGEICVKFTFSLMRLLTDFQWSVWLWCLTLSFPHMYNSHCFLYLSYRTVNSSVIFPKRFEKRIDT